MLFRKIRLSPIVWEPFKDSVPSRTVIGHKALNGQIRSKGAPVQEFTNALWKNSVSMAKCGLIFFIVIYLFHL